MIIIEAQKYVTVSKLAHQMSRIDTFLGGGYFMDNIETNILYVSPNPVVQITNNQFHSDYLPAIKFKTWEGYYLKGVNFPKELWEQVISKKMSFDDIMKIQNVDQRTIALSYCNVEDLLKGMDAKLIHEGKPYMNYDMSRTLTNKLYLIENKINGFPKAWFCRYNCPSTHKEYLSGIDPEFAEKNQDADECLAWKLGLTSGKEYLLLDKRA